eukprot:217933-Pelagomonas_calceolata.AAC.1
MPSGNKLVGIHDRMGMTFASKFNGMLVVKSRFSKKKKKKKCVGRGNRFSILVKGMLSVHVDSSTQRTEAHSLLSSTKAGCRNQKGTIHQLQNTITGLEDAKTLGKDIYALIVDFTSAFNTTDNNRMLWIMYDLGFPTDATHTVKFSMKAPPPKSDCPQNLAPKNISGKTSC